MARVEERIGAQKSRTSSSQRHFGHLLRFFRIGRSYFTSFLFLGIQLFHQNDPIWNRAFLFPTLLDPQPPAGDCQVEVAGGSSSPERGYSGTSMFLSFLFWNSLKRPGIVY